MIDFSPESLYDLSVKLVTRRHPAVVLRLAGVNVDPSTVTSIETGIIIKELEGDDVLVYPAPGGREGLLVEYEAGSDPRKRGRWLQKALAFSEELKIPVVLLVIYLRKTDRATFHDSFNVGSGPLKNRYTFATVRLWEQADRIRGGELVELAPLLPLAEDTPPKVAVLESKTLILSSELPLDAKEELLSVSYLIGLKYLVRSALDKIFGEELGMLKEAGIIGEWIEESKKLAHQEGLEEGREEGLRIAALRVVEGRFGTVPDDLRARIEAADAPWCENLISNAMRVESLSELSLP
jgi:predicted transposase YdaD